MTNLPFKKGEKVVYPAHGVAVIEDIQSRVISGTERRFYMLKILGTEKMTIMIPTENVTQVGLRRVIGKDVVDKIYRILRTRKVDADTQTWNRRYREYTEKIKTRSPDRPAPSDRKGCGRQDLPHFAHAQGRCGHANVEPPLSRIYGKDQNRVATRNREGSARSARAQG